MKKNYKKKLAILLAVWLIVLFVAFILSKPKQITSANAFTEWKIIQKNGCIRAGILQNTTDYYVENGSVKGFHYDLMELFGENFNLTVQYKVYPTFWDNFWALMTNEIDILAMDLNNEPQELVFFLDLLTHWAVNKKNTSLQEVLNNWFDSLINSRIYPVLLTKYYSTTSKNRVSMRKNQQKIENNFISFRYDDLIKKHAKTANLDWRFVAAIIYRESGFNADATGKGGAFGLMQIMPQTAVHIGMKNSYSPESQILYGCKYIKKLEEKYTEKGVDSTDLYKFVLAAYNAGTCHIDDAQLLAKNKGYNPNSWQNIEKMLLKLSDRKFTKHVPLQCGSYNGKFTKKYVSKVWETYQHYQNMTE